MMNEEITTMLEGEIKDTFEEMKQVDKCSEEYVQLLKNVNILNSMSVQRDEVDLKEDIATSDRYSKDKENYQKGRREIMIALGTAGITLAGTILSTFIKAGVHSADVSRIIDFETEGTIGTKTYSWIPKLW